MRGQRELPFDRYVFDADSLINLERTNRLRHLSPPGDAITVPHRVAREVDEPGSALRRWLRHYPKVISHFATTHESSLYVALRVQDPALGDGEAAAIAMAYHRRATLVMDDGNARRTAAAHGLSPIGTEEFLRHWPRRRGSTTRNALHQ